MPNPLRALAATAALLLSASSAQAGTGGTLVDYHVVGEVMATHNPALASYGVIPGAPVDIVWTVDLATPVYAASPAPDNVTDYQGALTWFKIEIGSWLAIRIIPPMGDLDLNLVSVANNSNGPLDLLHMTTLGTDNDLVLHGPAVGGQLLLSLDFYAPNGGGSSNQSLDQDPSLYPLGVGSAFGAGGYVTFSITGSGSGGSGGGSGDPTAKCVTAQVKSAAKLCQSQFKCQAKYAKAPLKDPMGDKLDDCMATAGQTFTKGYNKALLAAARKGVTCGTTEPALDLRVAITERVEGVVDDVGEITPVHAPLVSSWLTAAGAACGAGLKAEAANAAKPNPSKLGQARGKATDKLTSAANKAVEKAGKKEILFVPPADVPAFVDSVDALIDDTTADLDGN